jgi:hypothetical protein
MVIVRGGRHARRFPAMRKVLERVRFGADVI